MKRALYISYDGMTDPLGQSQVINYLTGLRAQYGYEFDILSFEKPDKFELSGSYIKQLLEKNGIRWFPQKYHNALPVVSKIYDRLEILKKAHQLHRENKYDLIHCRSYLAGEVGLKLRKKYGVPFLFDMRGFWPNEKADGGTWDQRKWFWRQVFKFYKKKEKELVEGADHIIVLTKAAKKEVMSWSFYKGAPVTVIPCCANTDFFLPINNERRAAARKQLAIPEGSYVLSYLGSLGTWYMIDEMLLFFSKLKQSKPEAFFLIISNSEPGIILSRLDQFKINESDIKIINVPFKDVPQNMYASDISISFITPVYSKTASSPVKLGEILSMGIPVVANNIGDSGTFVDEHGLGVMIEEMSAEQMDMVISNLDKLNSIDPLYIRKIATEEYGIARGVELYGSAYAETLQAKSAK